MKHAELLGLTPEEKKAWFKQATITHRLLEQTDRALMRAIREHGGFAYVFVYGPSGAGKTTMIHQVSQRLTCSIGSLEPALTVLRSNPLGVASASTPHDLRFALSIGPSRAGRVARSKRSPLAGTCKRFS